MTEESHHSERVDFRLQNDSCMIISGPSKSGKTSFVIEMLRRKDVLFQHPIRRTFWFHGAAQSSVHDMLRQDMGVILKHGIPNEDDFEPVGQYDLVVLDDLQHEMKNDSHITSLFLKHSHHRQFFVIVLQQNIYGDKEQRYRNANAHYWVAFNNPRNQRQVSEFLSRMYASGGKHAIERIFAHILETEGNYGYLFVDFTPDMRSDLRLRSHVFTSPMHVYKVNERGSFNEWIALSTLSESEGAATMSYDNMVLVPKAHYQSMVGGGGASKSAIKALLEPKKAYAEAAAKDVLDFKITPETVSDYYTKLSQFDKIRRDFFLPKAKEAKPLPTPTKPPAAADAAATTTPNVSDASTTTPSQLKDSAKEKSVKQRLKHLRALTEKQRESHTLERVRRKLGSMVDPTASHPNLLKRLSIKAQRKMLKNEPVTKRLPARLRGHRSQTLFHEYGQLSS